ncbi:PD-(D/E)XK nuclease family protein [Leptothermofonsia sp. ETS-13]|uniref:PD-(D/E)XK nuclease family protein n=1 Tax=Leptothermofonsia sp. ETS-13 TaxID=3035696 RepID=UPI003BA28305
MNPLPPLRLSQGHLNLLSACPRKFQHTYLEQLASPTTPEQLERLAAGSQFHLLMQQWQLELPIEPFVEEDTQLQRWFSSFTKAMPQILKLDKPGGNVLRQSEYALTVEFQGYLLTVAYDLLISNSAQAKILDWKTYPQPQNPRWLLQNWQTRLYPFVLAETGFYLPEQISMTYWFFQAEGEASEEAQHFTVVYDTARHEETRRDLTQLLIQLTHWLERYQAGESFPQVSLGASLCDSCNYAIRCDRTPSPPVDHEPIQNKYSLSSDFTLPNLADIQEIPL